MGSAKLWDFCISTQKRAGHILQAVFSRPIMCNIADLIIPHEMIQHACKHMPARLVSLPPYIFAIGFTWNCIFPCSCNAHYQIRFLSFIRIETIHTRHLLKALGVSSTNLGTKTSTPFAECARSSGLFFYCVL